MLSLPGWVVCTKIDSIGPPAIKKRGLRKLLLITSLTRVSLHKISPRSGCLRAPDSLLSFQEILLAEKWAKMNKLPFPKIDPNVFDREGMKECYVFKPKDTSSEKDCPTIIHFVLANINFRKYRAPGERAGTDAKPGCSCEAL